MISSIVCVACLAAVAGSEESTIRYRVGLENANHNEANIQIEVRDLPDEPIEFVMSRTSPGRYAIHQFAKNVYEVYATDLDGNPLDVTHPAPHRWIVAHHPGTIRFQYVLFGDLADGTYTAFDRDHAHMNMPATFMWVRGLHERPIELRILPRAEDWRVATQLQPTDDPFVFRAPNLAYFLDSPTEASPHEVREWIVRDQDSQQTVRLALHHQGTDAELDVYALMAERVTREQLEVFGEYPSFEFGTYTFIADYLPYVSGDGMEHRNSTILTSRRGLSLSSTSNLGTLSHEFFHCWNVERIRPRSLEPFDFEAANPSRELWFAEGFTSYYDDLIIHRSGLSSFDEYVSGLEYRINAVSNSPGRRIRSAADMSELAVYVDAARSVDPQNTDNTFISYYTFGDAIALALDLTLRSQHQKTLDGYMQAVWQKFGRQERPYTNADLQQVLAEYSDEEFAEQFFSRYIVGREVAPYASLLECAGISLAATYPNRASLGNVRFSRRSGGVAVSVRTPIGSPLYNAGIDINCRIDSVDGQAIESTAMLDALIEQKSPGDTIQVGYSFRDEQFDVPVVLAEDSQLSIQTFEALGKEVTDEILRFRDEWLSGRADQSGAELYRVCPTCGQRFSPQTQHCPDDSTQTFFSK